MPCRSDSLILGVLCASILRVEAYRGYIISHKKLLYSLLTLSIIGYSTIIAQKWSGKSFEMVVYGLSIISVSYSLLLVISVSYTSGFISIIFRNNLLGNLGRVAYGVYMFHQGVNGLIHILLLDQVPQLRGFMDICLTLLSLIVTLTVAHLSWKFFEKPIVAIGHSFRYIHSQSVKN